MKLSNNPCIALIAAALLGSSGCSSFYEQPVPLSERPLLYKEAFVRVIDPQHDFDNIRQHGLILMYDKNGVRNCDIYLRDYPRYLGHEFDHCFRGKWHGDEASDHDFK